MSNAEAESIELTKSDLQQLKAEIRQEVRAEILDEVRSVVDIRADDPERAGIEDIWIAGQPLGKLVHQNNRKCDDVEQKIEQQATSAPDTAAAQSDENAPSADGITPMHQLINAGEAGVIGHVTASVRRAKAMAEHFTKWATKAPNGLVVRENLKSLLETATGENLAWKQVYRAAHALAKFTQGTIAFKKTQKHGWILIAQPDDHRLRPLSASGG